MVSIQNLDRRTELAARSKGLNGRIAESTTYSVVLDKDVFDRLRFFAMISNHSMESTVREMITQGLQSSLAIMECRE